MENGSVNTSDRKLFVGGMHQDTGDWELREHFGKYGEIEHINIKTDSETGRSRGFAFIIFKSSDALRKVEAAGDHVINGKKVAPMKAKMRQGRIFVGGLSSDLTDEDIKTHFAQFGTIAEAQMPFDKFKNQRRGFCFIVFESEDVARSLLKKPKQYIKGREVDVKKAETKPEQPDWSMQEGRGGMRGARGGRGGYGMQDFNQENFDGYWRESKYDQRGEQDFNEGTFDGFEQDFNYRESVPAQRGGSMIRGLARGRGRGGYGVQDFNESFDGYQQAFTYPESVPAQRGDSLLRGRAGSRGGMRGTRGGRGGHGTQDFGSYEQSSNYHESKPDHRGGTTMRGRGGVRGARGSGVQNFSQGSFDGYEQAVNRYEPRPDQRGGSMMRGRGGSTDARGGFGGRGGYGRQGFNQDSGRGFSCFRGNERTNGVGASRGGYGQRYQPY